jgi:PAT family beta-lactamase induction signal transducer AmpG
MTATADGAGGPARLSTLQSLTLVFTSRRTASVAIQSFFSGMPLGLVWVAIPAWMARAGIDIRTIGLLTLAQTPWTFKFLWSPLMDRYRPPFLGRKRGWAVVAQVGLLVTTLGLAWGAARPQQPLDLLGFPLEWAFVIGSFALAVAFASTVQDIAVDAYAVEVLRPEEHGIAVGARTALYRSGFYLAGAVAISIASAISWPVTLALQAVSYLVAVLVILLSPEPEAMPAPPRTLRGAVWEPLVGLFAQHRAVEIAAFLFLYKFGENLAQALLRPFLVQAGYSDNDVGVWTGLIGFVVAAVSTIAGGVATTRIGLGHALWLFGFLQAAGNIGYFFIAGMSPNRPAMYAAVAFETFAQGLGTAAFGVLLLRLTQKRFSATQYALLSSIFALGRVVTGPIAGFLVDAMGWRPFFIVSIVMAAPGLATLQRFVPLGSREPVIEVEAPSGKPKVGRAALVARGASAAAVGLVAAAVSSGTLDALKAYRAHPDLGFRLVEAIAALGRPAGVAGWSETIGIALFAIFAGLGAAALTAARRGVERS